MAAPGPDALICDIQRFSVHDGPGIRTTVFFKGCPLACRWCHNPETIEFRNAPVYSPGDCIGCGDCIAACPENALVMTESGIRTDTAACSACLKCTDVCPAAARAPAAHSCSVDELLAELLRDRPYYGSDGGVTLSGGEPVAHPRFLTALLPRLKHEEIDIAVETSGHWEMSKLRSLLPLVDLFLFDLKAADPDRHRALTGRGNERIITNLRTLVAEGFPVTVRMPVVPGLNTGSHEIDDAAELLTSLGAASVTLIPYHGLGEAKGARSDSPLDTRPPTPAELADISQRLGRRGVEPMLQE